MPEVGDIVQLGTRKHVYGPASKKKSKDKKCNAKRADGRACRLGAGHGTSHVGLGRCKYHGGAVPNALKWAAKEEYRMLLGRPIEINPLDAIMKCIQIRAGEVEWLSHRMAELEEQHWIEDTMIGKQFHLYARERGAAMNDLVRYSQVAISLGIAERAVKLAETYGEMIARLIQGILGDLDLSEDQRTKAPEIVRHHLLALNSIERDSGVAALTYQAKAKASELASDAR